MFFTTRSPLQAKASIQTDFEKEMVDGFVQAVGRTGIPADRIETVNLYVALKSKPLALLVGPAGTGKLELVRCLAYSLMGGENLHYQKLGGHPWWAEKCENIAVFTVAQRRFIIEKLFCMIEEAWKPENAKKVFLACLARISPAEILDFYSSVAFQLRYGQLMRLGNVHLKEPVPWPPNLLLMGTMDTVHYDWWDDDLLAYTIVILWNPVGVEDAPHSFLEASFSKGESEFLRSIVRSEQAVHRKLHTILGWRQKGWLRQPIQPLLEIGAALGTFGIQLPPDLMREALVYLANAWTRQGNGLFDPAPLRNLAIALDQAIAQTILPRVVERIASSRVIFEGLRDALNGLFPRSACFLES